MPEMDMLSLKLPEMTKNDKFELWKVEMVVFASFELGNHWKCRVWVRRCWKGHFGQIWARKSRKWTKMHRMSPEWVGNASLSIPRPTHVFPRYWRPKWGENGACFSKINTNGVGFQVKELHWRDKMNSIIIKTWNFWFWPSLRHSNPRHSFSSLWKNHRDDFWRLDGGGKVEMHRNSNVNT